MKNIQQNQKTWQIVLFIYIRSNGWRMWDCW